MKQRPRFTLAAMILGLALAASSALPSRAAETKVPERAIVTKAKRIVLPEFKVDNVTLIEAIKKLTDAAHHNDPERQGFNFMIDSSKTVPPNAKITLALKKVSVAEAADRIAKAAGVRLTARDYAFVFNSSE